jgi:hypothetical protein
VQELFGKLHGMLQRALAQTQQQQQQQQQGSHNGTGRQQQHVRFDRWGNAEEDDDEDYLYLDAGNRSPTYKASIRQQRSGSKSSSEWGVLRLLLDCQEAMSRPGGGFGNVAAAGGQQDEVGWEGALRQQQQQQGGGRGPWQWGNGVDSRNAGAADSSISVGRKRERSDRR